MSEIAEFLHHGAEQITPKILEGIHKKLPALKLEIAEIDAPEYPHLVEQLGFLAGLVEDHVEGADDALPLVAVAEAAYALVYAHNQLGLIPNHLPHIGHADKSSIVRAILIENERVLSEYAERQNIDWVTVRP
ncbi:MAG: hypothetical protein CMO68_05530 [Verrucomicrobiales bacterium]|nr:hypothetical protein [Verrucomicrobiales bacterium]MEC8973849.1 hypothetical protein [Verrucomicrobiota bacterium]